VPDPSWWSADLAPVWAFGVPCLVSALLTALLIRWAPRLGLIDHPAARKVHTRPVPRGGGLAFFLAAVAGAYLLPTGVGAWLLPLLGAASAIVFLGLVDDLRPLPWQLRLGIQAAVVLYLVSRWQTDAGWGVRAVALVWIVGLVNAFNMLDNMDALSGGVAYIAAGMLALASVLRMEGPWNWAPALPYLVLMGALAGFLWFNRPPARIFMGDAGSTFLGLFLGVRSVEGGLVLESTPFSLAVPICLLAVPWYDLTSVVLLRLWQGRSPFHADKQHLSHRLVALGLSGPTAVGLIYLFALASGAAGLGLYYTVPVGAALLLAQLALWWVSIAGVEYARHFHPRNREPAARLD
jgi:UDP-GlcNAc:undecaprenyl-phosphate GlcNAc-1-phosphate transferase